MPIRLFNKHVSGLKSDFNTSELGLYSKIVSGVVHRVAKKTIEKIEPFLESSFILDIGMGSGAVTCLLTNMGYKVIGGDVINLCIFNDVKPIILNGHHLPFVDCTFDVALLTYVLHHCEEPQKVFREAKRVAKRVIVIEDTYRNLLEKIFVSLNDAIGNFEFFPHEYHTEDEWEYIIEQNGWNRIAFLPWTQFPGWPIYSRYLLMVVE